MTDFLDIDDCDIDDTLKIVEQFGCERFGYIVTPNVDHVIRYYYDRSFRLLYSQATYVLLDSRFLAHALGLLRRQFFRVCLGSDLTSSVLANVVKPRDVALLVGATPEQAEQLRTRFNLEALRHIDPPMNLLKDRQAIEDCLQAIEAASPFRVCFLAVGSPQQEMIAQQLKARGIARGLALCVGASINYITGFEKRAPRWMQQLGFEWLFRLSQNPRRMAKRYLVRGPLIFWLMWRIQLRPRRVGTVTVKECGGGAENLPATPATFRA